MLQKTEITCQDHRRDAGKGHRQRAEDVRRDIVNRYGEKALYMGGLAVRTTLEPKLQDIATRALRVRGLSAPMTTAAPPFCRRSSSAMAYTFSTEKPTIALRGFIRLIFFEPAQLSVEKAVKGTI